VGALVFGGAQLHVDGLHMSDVLHQAGHVQGSSAVADLRQCRLHYSQAVNQALALFLTLDVGTLGTVLLYKCISALTTVGVVALRWGASGVGGKRETMSAKRRGRVLF
jgi:hypothetical protein